jgi:hypothetical protein
MSINARFKQSLKMGMNAKQAFLNAIPFEWDHAVGWALVAGRFRQLIFFKN